MANRKVSIYVRTSSGAGYKYQKPTYVDKAQSRLKPIKDGQFYLRYTVDGASKLEAIGTDPYVAADKKHERERWLRNHIPLSIRNTPEPTERLSIETAIRRYFRELETFQGSSGYGTAPRTIKVYRARLILFQEFCAKHGIKYLGEVDNRDVLLRYIQSLQSMKQKNGKSFSDRYVFCIFQTANTFLRANNINTANPLLGKLGFAPKKPKMYSPADLKSLFALMHAEERLVYSFFLNSGCREQEVANVEYADLLFSEHLLHVCPKPERGFRLKSKNNRNGDSGDRHVPLPSALMAKLKVRMLARKAKPSDLVFPDKNGTVERHFWRKLNQIAKRGGLSGNWQLHRFRKTAATNWHDEGIPLGTIMTRLGHTNLRVTQLYLELKGGGRTTPEVVEQVNKSALAAYV